MTPNINGSRASEIHINPVRVRKFIEEIEAQEIDIEELKNYDRHYGTQRRRHS